MSGIEAMLATDDWWFLGRGAMPRGAVVLEVKAELAGELRSGVDVGRRSR